MKKTLLLGSAVCAAVIALSACKFGGSSDDTNATDSQQSAMTMPASSTDNSMPGDMNSNDTNANSSMNAGPQPVGSTNSMNPTQSLQQSMGNSMSNSSAQPSSDMSNAPASTDNGTDMSNGGDDTNS